MKNYFLIISLIAFVNLESQSQNIQAHQIEAPPINPGGNFSRGIYVDCSDDIVHDISIGNPNGLEAELISYLQNNFIDYAILCGLENSFVFGNPVLENSLRRLLEDMRSAIPGIKIGVGGSSDYFFQQTAFLRASDDFAKECFPNGSFKSIQEFNDALNYSSTNSSAGKVSELCKFFFRAAQFEMEEDNLRKSRSCKSAFDALYVQYRYWNHTSSLALMKSEFENLKKIISFMKILKCNYTCIQKCDAEFLPSDFFTLQGWTAIDQITDLDPITDRLMIPHLTSDANSVFDKECKTLHYLSDIFSKQGSEIYIEVSAESPSFNYCSSAIVPQYHLGNYLNGTTTSSGNMYSVEKKFLDTFNDPGYFCSPCLCYPYIDNHYSSTNIYGNILNGFMWKPYSMMKDHDLFRKKKEVVTNESAAPVNVQLFDMNGRMIQNKNSTGIYFLKKIYENHKVEYEKVLIR
jgi:hypothetical protein